MKRRFILLMLCAAILQGPAPGQDLTIGIPIYEKLAVHEVEPGKFAPAWVLELTADSDERPLLGAGGDLIVVAHGRTLRGISAQGVPLWTLSLRTAATSLAVSRQGRRIAVSCPERNEVLLVTPLPDGKSANVRHLPCTRPSQLAFDAERRLLAGTDVGWLLLVDLEGRRAERSVPLLDRKTRAYQKEYGLDLVTLQLFPDGHTLFYNVRDAGNNGSVYYKNLATGQISRIYQYAESDSSQGYRFGIDARFVVSTQWTHPGDGGYEIGRVVSFDSKGRLRVVKLAAGFQFLPEAFDATEARIAYTWTPLLERTPVVRLDVMDPTAGTVHRVRLAERVHALRFIAESRMVLLSGEVERFRLSLHTVP